jgi:hypothetical protein
MPVLLGSVITTTSPRPDQHRSLTPKQAKRHCVIVTLPTDT